MEECLNLLVVEDNDGQIKAWETAIDLFNRDKSKNLNLKAEIKKDLESGLAAISSNNFDAAIVDLKLSPENSELDGNKIITEIQKKQRFPIVVVSGLPQDMKETTGEENALFKVYKRDQKPFKDILMEIVSIYNTGITKLLGRGENGLISSIEKSLQEIFWSHISHSFDEISSSLLDTKKVLMRYTLTHLFEYLSEGDTTSSEFYYEGEMYMLPAINDNLATGVLLKDKASNEFFIILTPACDMVIRKNGSRKAEKIMLVQIEGIESISQNKNGKDIEKLFKNNSSLNYHFLPPIKKFVGGFINFQHISSIEDKKITDKFSIIGKVTAPFLKDIISRFSTYYARQGQPELDIKAVHDKIIVKKNQSASGR
ncbi:MAG: hypothetical protein MUF15_13560 [Acidobacteria bacterium]|nr:hypothetical protein [Acidobacteriota bacterium]